MPSRLDLKFSWDQGMWNSVSFSLVLMLFSESETCTLDMTTFMLFVISIIPFLFSPKLFSNGQPDSAGPMRPVCPFLGQKELGGSYSGGKAWWWSQ